MFEFDWDPQKAARNHVRHGVSFELAINIFNDPHIIYLRDYYVGEVRDWAIGSLPGDQLLVVVHMVVYEDQETTQIRIISARTADRRERILYREAQA